ncbi:MAG: ABC transporter substrate-binding protein [Rhodospirillales bacterium]|nr:ABC transporter substrate-binding protein [Rhodospirillales bacterium]
MRMKHGYPIALALLAAFALTSATAEAQTPKKGGTLKFAVLDEPPSYDCHRVSTFAFIHPVRPHYSTLLEFDPDKYPTIRGDLAQSWDISKDGLTYTFKLRSGVKFHDGSALTSADVKATYERISNPPQGVVSLRKASYGDITSIETPDALTVVFKLRAPNASMLANFASPWDCIYSAAKIKTDPKFPEKNVLGTGPFKFVEHVSGSHWVGERFNDYFEPGKPYLDNYRAIFIKSSAAIVNALQGGEIHTEFRGFTPADRDKLVGALGNKVVVQESPWVCNLVLAFNTEKKPFDDARVRRALSLALDRWKGSEALSKIAIVKPVGGILRPGYELAASPADLEKIPGMSKNIEKSRAEAKRLLKEAGVSNLKFKLTNRNVPMPYTPVAVWMLDQWRQLGITAEHEQLDSKLYFDALRSGNYQAGVDFNCDHTDDPSLQFIKYLSSDKSTINYGRYSDRTLDHLYEMQARTTDPEQRKTFVREFEFRALSEAYTVPTIWYNRIIVHAAQMKGWKITPSHYINQDLADVWLDQ